MKLAPLGRLLLAAAFGGTLAAAGSASPSAQVAAPPVHPSIPPNFNGPHSGIEPHRGEFGAKIDSAGRYVGPAGDIRDPGRLDAVPPRSRRQARPRLAQPNRATNRVFNGFRNTLDARGRAKAEANGEPSVPR